MGKMQIDNACVTDSLELLDAEIEELENDELSAEEAGFLFGYDTETEDDQWWAKEDIQLRQMEESLGEVA